jgi:hypothetical protein
MPREHVTAVKTDRCELTAHAAASAESAVIHDWGENGEPRREERKRGDTRRGEARRGEKRRGEERGSLHLPLPLADYKPKSPNIVYDSETRDHIKGQVSHKTAELNHGSGLLVKGGAYQVQRPVKGCRTEEGCWGTGPRIVHLFGRNRSGIFPPVFCFPHVRPEKVANLRCLPGDTQP